MSSLGRVVRLANLARNLAYSQPQSLVFKNNTSYFFVNNNKRLYSIDSNDSEKNEFDEEQLRKSILEKSLKHIDQDGFTFDAILKGTFGI